MSRRTQLRKARRTKFRRRPHGAPPGTLVADPAAPRPKITLMAFGPGECHERAIENVNDLAECRGRWPVVWVNIDGLGDAATVGRIGEIFGLHRLALEDVLNVNQRTKFDDYGDHYFLVLKMVDHALEGTLEQLSIFQGPGFVLTFQERPKDGFENLRDRVRAARGRVRDAGADYLVYCLLDAVVDDYFPMLERFGDHLEQLEDETLANPKPDSISQIHDVKRDLRTLRRAIWPLRDVINALAHERSGLITESTYPYLRDCVDHVVRVIELLETYREVAADLLEVHLSSVSNRMNEIMRVLTVISTIFIPLTFVVGVYGMNFHTSSSRWNMPELDWRFGYPIVMGGMAVLAGSMLFFFWRRGWLGSPKNLRHLPQPKEPEAEPPPKGPAA